MMRDLEPISIELRNGACFGSANSGRASKECAQVRVAAKQTAVGLAEQVFSLDGTATHGTDFANCSQAKIQDADVAFFHVRGGRAGLR
jgi:hypothetical protein